MGTLVAFHAHPDDEAIATGGSMARAHAEGHRVVLVVATDGEHGEVPDDLADGETLADRRRAETERSAAALGVDRLVWLGYADSGMTGWEANLDEASFWKADVDEAAERLADVLREERADVLHHLRLARQLRPSRPHQGPPGRLSRRAVVADELPGLRVFEATMNRDEMRRQMAQAREMGQSMTPDDVEDDFDPDGPMDDGNPMGTAEDELTHRGRRGGLRRAQARSRSRPTPARSTDSGFFLQMPDGAFAVAFGRGWFIEHGREPGMRPGWLFDER